MSDLTPETLDRLAHSADTMRRSRSGSYEQHEAMRDVLAAFPALIAAARERDHWFAVAVRPVEAERDAARAELAALRERVEVLRAVVEEEATDDVEAAVRAEVADVRCLDCDLRYGERQEYGCFIDGRGHSYAPGALADAEQTARAEAREYVTLPLTEVRVALADPATDKEAGQ